MENIRITSGKLRGRSIKSPKSDLVHPMGAREKIALFNMISENLSDAVVLDAFAGSGALGIEALSRGAKEVIFVERNPQIAKNLKESIKSLNLDDASEVIVTDVSKFATEKKFDIILADPPYDKFKLEDILHLTQFLKHGGILVLSHPDDAIEIPNLTLKKTKKYARARISIFTF